MNNYHHKFIYSRSQLIKELDKLGFFICQLFFSIDFIQNLDYVFYLSVYGTGLNTFGHS